MENVQDRWANILPQVMAGDTVTFFYTDKVKPVPMGVLGPACARGVNFSFAQCENGRPNALDFQLVTELGRLSVLSENAEFVIVSGDQGFQSVIKFMGDRGVTVSCLDPDKIALSCDDCDDNTGSVHMTGTVDWTYDAYVARLKRAGLPESQAHTVAGVFMSAMCEPPNKRKLACCNLLRTCYGADFGSDLYVKIKGVVHDVAVNGPFPKPDSRSLPDENTLSVMLKNNGLNLSNTHLRETVLALKQAVWRQNPRQSLMDRLVKRLGNKKGAAVYKFVAKLV